MAKMKNARIEICQQLLYYGNENPGFGRKIMAKAFLGGGCR